MSGDESKGEKEKESMDEYLGQRPPSRPPTRSTTPLVDQQQGDFVERFDENENARIIEEIFNTHLEGFKKGIENAKQQALATPGKETKIQAFKNKMINYLKDRPTRYTAKQEKYPEYTQEEIYETLQDDDQERWEKLERSMAKIQAQFENFNREQDTVNKVVTKTRRSKTRQKKNMTARTTPSTMRTQEKPQDRN